MAEGDKKSPGGSRITDKERYNYIGFEVFPGTPKDLFKSEAEKTKLVEAVKSRRLSKDTLRDDCKLLEERVSYGERMVLAAASIVIFLALLLPWYSAYTVVQDKTPQANAQAGGTTTSGEGVTSHRGERANEEIITGRTTQVRNHKEYTDLSGFGTFISIGSIAGKVFSSGLILILSGLLMLSYGLLCLVLPVINLYSLFGLKGKPDELAIQLKKNLRLNWLPLLILVALVVLSLLGSSYGFDAQNTFTSLGTSYGIVTIFNTLSWGVFIAVAASLLVALKGIEI
jgi:hypothetical protein